MSAVTERRKRGEPHPSGDGRVFARYYRTSKGEQREQWLTKEMFEKKMERLASYRPENKDRAKEYNARYRAANLEKFKENQARWKAVNLEKFKEYSARYRAANPGKVKAANDRWREANPEKEKEKSARWYRENAERINANAARRRMDNPEKCRAAVKRWYAANPEKVRGLRSRRRARERGALHAGHSTEIEIVLFQSAARLRECLGIDFHLDHIIPLARGGMHHHTNLRVLPGRFNVVKSDKLDSELPSHLLGAIKQWTPFLN